MSKLWGGLSHEGNQAYSDNRKAQQHQGLYQQHALERVNTEIVQESLKIDLPDKKRQQDPEEDRSQREKTLVSAE